MKEYISQFGHGFAKLARQAQSKKKTLAKMECGGLTEKVVRDKTLIFHFAHVGKLPPLVLQFVEGTFGYTPDNLIYKNIDFVVDLDSRIALMGPNGVENSTLLKLVIGDLVSIDSMVRRHNHLRIAQFHQHLAEKLDLEMSVFLYMIREYPGNEEERMITASIHITMPSSRPFHPGPHTHKLPYMVALYYLESLHAYCPELVERYGSLAVVCSSA